MGRLVCRPVGPGTDQGHKRDNALRCRNLGLKPLWKCIEVTQSLERKVELLDLRPQAEENIVDPSREV